MEVNNFFTTIFLLLPAFRKVPTLYSFDDFENLTFDLELSKISQSDFVGTLFTWKSTFFSIRIHSFHLCIIFFLTLLILVLRFTRLYSNLILNCFTASNSEYLYIGQKEFCIILSACFGLVASLIRTLTHRTIWGYSLAPPLQDNRNS